MVYLYKNVFNDKIIVGLKNVSVKEVHVGLQLTLKPKREANVETSLCIEK